MASLIKNDSNINAFYDLSAKTLSGTPFPFSKLKGKVTLIVNVASFWGTTVRDYHQLAQLHTKYQDKGLVIIGVPCNQFGHQEPGTADEIPKCLKYVRPGDGFEVPFTLLEKVQVNGAKTHPIYSYLKSSVSPPDNHIMTDINYIIWAPVQRLDLAWNFEKFLIDKEGNTFKRYVEKVAPLEIEADIVALLKWVRLITACGVWRRCYHEVEALKRSELLLIESNS